MITLEKLILLHGIPLFRYTSDEILLELAFALTEQYALPGETIVEKGEFSTDMYLIAWGKVKVHDGDKILAQLAEHDVFGELAALSPEVRIASVSALENTLLLKISHDVLYEIMARNIGLVRGIVEVLCQRTRAIAGTR
jgi:CRP/FNR family transcriptional regulator, cyclic AMP receptor protein